MSSSFFPNDEANRIQTYIPKGPSQQQPLSSSEERSVAPDYRVLNPSIDLVGSPDFFPVAPTQYGVQEPGGWTSYDPRLIDTARRGDRLLLDAPVRQPANVQPLGSVYTSSPETLPLAGPVAGYSSLRGGNNVYYLSRELMYPYTEPLYEIRSFVTPFVFQDPMGSRKPYYLRSPLSSSPRYLSNYTFDQDQMSFREDIMSRQSERMNRTDIQLYDGMIQNIS